MDIITWIFIFLSLIQSGIFSGLTIGLFGLSRLGLETEAEAGNRNAAKILNIRKDSNYLLTTLLWGNVAINVLIALLTESVMNGTVAFLFSTVLITCMGEIAPQAYFSRNALKIGANLVPLVRFYQILLYPVAKPSAMVLDHRLGKEKLAFFKEASLRKAIEKHIESPASDIGEMEGIGALNFLSLDDVSIMEEGSIINPESIISLPVRDGMPVFPDIEGKPSDPLLRKMAASGEKWVIVTDLAGNPVKVVNSNDFIRDALCRKNTFNPIRYCHLPVIVINPEVKLENVIPRLKVYPIHEEDDIIDLDVILYWGKDEKRIITGTDILGRLLRGIVRRVP
jgi:CBS domain containing-hemolysin-like protein